MSLSELDKINHWSTTENLNLRLEQERFSNSNKNEPSSFQRLTEEIEPDFKNNNRIKFKEEVEEEVSILSEFDSVSQLIPNSNLNELMMNRNTANKINSSPNTPESLRKAHNLISKHYESNGNLRNSIDGMSGKKDKMEFNMMMRMSGGGGSETGRPLSYHDSSNSSSPILLAKRIASPLSSPRTKSKDGTSYNRRSMPMIPPGSLLENRLKEKLDLSDLDTNLPKIDLEAIENHLRQAREEEKKRKSDRDEIRRRLALESEELYEKPGRKPSLHTRLQSSMNLQICFMNETASDSESPSSDSEGKGNQTQPMSLPYFNSKVHPIQLQQEHAKSSSQNSSEQVKSSKSSGSTDDFYARQAKLQADARHALSQAKDLAKLQMSHERDKRMLSPITEMVRNSLTKVGITLPADKRRVSRQLLTDMNVAQLQVIVNDLHTYIEELNEKLVSMLLDRDDLHMEQDSMLVDIEDLTRYLAAKDNSPHQSLPLIASSKTLLGKK